MLSLFKRWKHRQSWEKKWLDLVAETEYNTYSTSGDIITELKLFIASQTLQKEENCLFWPNKPGTARTG